jgi:hypothetical protein
VGLGIAAPSFGEKEIERLAAGDARILLAGHEDEAKCVDHILARFFARPALADGARNTVDARDDPPVFIGLVVRDRQP